MDRPAPPGLPELTPVDGGRATRVPVRAQPGARRRGVVGLWNGHLKVALRAPAQDGRANEELLAVLGDAFDLTPPQVRLERGQRARCKQVVLALSPERVRSRLLGLLGPER